MTNHHSFESPAYPTGSGSNQQSNFDRARSQSLDRLGRRNSTSESDQRPDMDMVRTLAQRRSLDQLDRRNSTSEGNQRPDMGNVRFLYQSGSPAVMPASESRPHDTQSLRRQSLDRHSNLSGSPSNLNDVTHPLARHPSQERASDAPVSHPTGSQNPTMETDIVRSLTRSQSSDGLASHFIQPESRAVRTSRSSDNIDPNITAERRETIFPLSRRQSFDGTLPLEASRQSLEHTPVPENKPLDAHISSDAPTPSSIVAGSSDVQPLSSELSSRSPLGSTEIWRPPLARRGDTIQSRGDFASSFANEHTLQVYGDGNLDAHRQDEITPVVPGRLTGSAEIWRPSRRGDTIHLAGGSASSFANEHTLQIYEDRNVDVRRRGRDEITVVRSPRLEIVSRGSMDERGSNHTNDGDLNINDLNLSDDIKAKVLDASIKLAVEALDNSWDKKEYSRRLNTRITEIVRVHDQGNQQDARDAETLLNAMGIRNDDLVSSNYLDAKTHAQTIARVIRTNGQDKEFNDATKALLELAPKRSRLRSLVNPTRDTIDWYDASWRNQHAMSKLDTTTWRGSIRKGLYQANQLVAGPLNTRSGNLSFISFQALAGSAYTSYLEGKFNYASLGSNLEYAALARPLYKYLPTNLAQAFDTLQFQGFSIGLSASIDAIKAAVHHNATMGG